MPTVRPLHFELGKEEVSKHDTPLSMMSGRFGESVMSSGSYGQSIMSGRYGEGVMASFS